MSLSRRSFLGGAASFGALAGCRVFRAPAGLLSGSGARLTLGVIGDIHIDCGRGGFKKFGDATQFVKTLRWFEAQGVDGVVVAGDMADNGMVNQLQCVADAWFAVFPDNCSARDGRHVEPLFVYGNHDLEGQRYDGFGQRYFERESFAAAQVLRDPKGVWEDVFHEEYSPIWRKEVKGYSFVGAHWVDRHWDGIAAVEPYFAEHANSFDPSQPFFFIQHPHPKDTVYGDDAWGADKGYATRALSAFPNAVAFSGHSHESLTDERSIWQGAFTSVATSSLRYGGAVDKYAQRQGLLVRVYDDRMAFVRRDFLNDASLGDDWIVPLPAAAPKPFSFVARKAKGVPPEFAKGAKLQVAREGKGDKAGFLVTIPPADAGVTRAFRYEIATGLRGKDGKDLLFYAADAKYNMPRYMATVPTKHLVKLSALPEGAQPSFAVTPLDAFGNRGKTLWA